MADVSELALPLGPEFWHAQEDHSNYWTAKTLIWPARVRGPWPTFRPSCWHTFTPRHWPTFKPSCWPPLSPSTWPTLRPRIWPTVRPGIWPHIQTELAINWHHIQINDRSGPNSNQAVGPHSWQAFGPSTFRLGVQPHIQPKTLALIKKPKQLPTLRSHIQTKVPVLQSSQNIAPHASTINLRCHQTSRPPTGNHSGCSQPCIMRASAMCVNTHCTYLHLHYLHTVTLNHSRS